ncbi:MAG: hypothetical protein J6A23_13280 [Thermoguttaceae bacterium]|nr:hypothetical protein [Thermoguttaceae bacterium]
MKRHLLGYVFALVFLMVSAAQAQVEKCHISLHSGDLIRSATITKMGRDVLTVDAGGSSEKVAVGNISSITFVGEPAEMKDIRTYLADSRFEDMLDTLKEVSPEQLSVNMKKEVEYLRVRAVAGLAFNGSVAIPKALTEMKKYFSSKDNSEYYRFYELSELYANLNMLIGTEDALKEAEGAFQMIASAKDSPILKARGLIGAGNIALMKEKAAEAEKAFKAVITMVKNQEVEGVRDEMEVSASCGLARAEVLEGKTEEAIAEIQKIFSANKISAEDPMNALLYNALGYAQLKANKPKDAAIAYMHTHLLYNGNKQQHIEALDAMIKIFREELRDENRARDLEGIKASRYGAKKG